MTAHFASFNIVAFSQFFKTTVLLFTVRFLVQSTGEQIQPRENPPSHRESIKHGFKVEVSDQF